MLHAGLSSKSLSRIQCKSWREKLKLKKKLNYQIQFVFDGQWTPNSSCAEYKIRIENDSIHLIEKWIELNRCSVRWADEGNLSFLCEILHAIHDRFAHTLTRTKTADKYLESVSFEDENVMRCSSRTTTTTTTRTRQRRRKEKIKFLNLPLSTHTCDNCLASFLLKSTHSVHSRHLKNKSSLASAAATWMRNSNAFVDFSRFSSKWQKYSTFAVRGSQIWCRRCVHVRHRLHQSEWYTFGHLHRSFLLRFVLSAQGWGGPDRSRNCRK